MLEERLRIFGCRGPHIGVVESEVARDHASSAAVGGRDPNRVSRSRLCRDLGERRFADLTRPQRVNGAQRSTGENSLAYFSAASAKSSRRYVSGSDHRGFDCLCDASLPNPRNRY